MKVHSAVLGLLAGLSPSAWILACGASFSPDGGRILFPQVDGTRRQVSVVVFDRRTSKIRPLFAVSHKGGSAKNWEKPKLIAARWTPDGRHIVVLIPEREGPDHVRVYVLPVGADGHSRLFVLHEIDHPLLAAVLPPPMDGPRLFLGGESIVRLDIETGETTRRADKHFGEIILGGTGGTVYYFRWIWGKTESEFGTVAKDTLSLTRRLALKEGVSPFFAVSRDGKRVAFVVYEKRDPRTILVHEGETLVRSITLSPSKNLGLLGSLAWSHDGGILYAAQIQRGTEGKKLNFGVLEIAVESGAMREIPLFSVPAWSDTAESRTTEELLPVFQIALSPDGKLLAASTGCLELPAEKHGLYLVDLTGSTRQVRRIPLPAGTKPRAEED